MYIRNCKLHIWMCPLFRCLFLFCSSVSNFQIQSWFENRPLASFGMVNVQQGSAIWIRPHFKGQKEVSLQMVRISSRLWNPSAIENQPKRLASCICHLKSALFTPDFKSRKRLWKTRTREHQQKISNLVKSISLDPDHRSGWKCVQKSCADLVLTPV